VSDLQNRKWTIQE